MRDSLRCPKCQSARIGHLERVEDQDGDKPTRTRSLATGYSGTLFTGGMRRHAAEVEAWVCADCGFFEEYVKNPDGVKWDQLPGFRWAREPDDGDGPFR